MILKMRFILHMSQKCCTFVAEIGGLAFEQDKNKNN